MAKWRLCLGEPLRQSQGTPLAAFFNVPRREKSGQYNFQLK